MTRHEGDGPRFVAMFGPVLRAVGDLGGSARPREVYEHVAERLGLDADAIADSMAELARDSVVREALAQRGVERARRFSWDRSAEGLLTAFSEVAQ